MRQVGLLVHHAVDQRGRGAVAERAATGRGVDQHGAEREHVALRADLRADDLLRREEAGGAEHDPGLGERGVLQRPRDAEVDHPWAVRGEQHVGGLEVAVHQTGTVDRDQRLRQPRGQPAHGLLGQRPVRLHGLLEGRPDHVLRRHPRPVGVRVGVDDRGRPETADGASHVDLAAEAFAEQRALGQLGSGDLHRHRAATTGSTEVHRTHRAPTECSEQHVVPDALRPVHGQWLHLAFLLDTDATSRVERTDPYSW